MKYLTFFLVILTGLLIISCGEGPTYTEAYEYLTLINCNGSDKIHLSEDNPGKVFFYENNHKIIFAERDEIISFDLSELQSEIIFPPETEEWSIWYFEIFQDFDNILFCNDSNGWDLYLYTIETENVENLTNTDEKREGNIKLSATEEYFVYIEKDYTIGDSIKWSIKYRNFDETINETVISKFGSCGTTFRTVDWIDDNTLIYINDEYCLEPGIYSVNLNGSENQLIYDGRYFNFSICEDRTKVVFENNDEIYLIDTSDYSVSHLISGSKPVISPDGNKLSFYDGISGLVVWDMIEDTIALISETPRSSALGFSSDSQKLVFKERIIVTYNRENKIVN